MTRLLAAALAILLSSSAAAQVMRPPAPPSALRELVTLGNESFDLRIASTPRTRELGLMGWDDVAYRGGLLFVYPDTRHRRMWMKHCTIDIDLIWLDRNGTAVATYTMPYEPAWASHETEWDYEARLRRYPSRRPARFAIELRAGTIERLGLKVGDQVPLDLARLRKLGT